MPAIVIALHPGAAYAPPVFTISNAPTGGSNFNAQRIADNLVSGGVLISAFVSIEIAADIDISHSALGPVAHDLRLAAPTIYVNGNVVIAGGTTVTLLADSVVVLNGTFSSGGVAVTGPQLSGQTVRVDVSSPRATISQAVPLVVSGALISVAPGSYFDNISLSLPVRLIGNAGDPLVAGADSSAPILGGLVAGGTIVSVLSPSVTIEGLRLLANVDGNRANDSAVGVAATAASNLVVTNNSFTAFTNAGVSLLSGDNESVMYNSFAQVGSATDISVASSVTSPNIHDNVVVPNPSAVPSMSRGQILAMAALLIAVGVIVRRRRTPTGTSSTTR